MILAVALPLFGFIMGDSEQQEGGFNTFKVFSIILGSFLWIWACGHLGIYYGLPKWSIILSLLYLPGLIVFVWWGRYHALHLRKSC